MENDGEQVEASDKGSIKDLEDAGEEILQSADEEEAIPSVEELIRRVEEFVEQDVRDIEALVLPEEDLEMFPEPHITSSDPHERRVARRLRIRNKLREKRKAQEAKIKEELGEDDDDADKLDPDNVVENQIEESTVRLLELIQDGRELISNVKVAAVSYEVKRRDKVRLERAERRERLQAAAEDARLRFMEISNQWAAVKAEKDPLDIHAATEQQREKCMEVIGRKDAIIEELKKELEEADANFVKDLERQEDEINILVDRINQQINIMRTAANNQLQLLEAATAVEREEMMKANETEWEELIEKKEMIESETNLTRNEIMEKHEKSIDAMETEQREQLKMKRTEQTTIIHDMQLQLQELEALCLFNSEKLNHNYRVLKKRADENQIIKSQQKRTITKLQDVLSSLRKKMAKKEMVLSNATKKMTNELSSLQRNIRDMERRAGQAASLSNSKFLALWDFNQSQAQQLVDKIAYADKIMYEQFLDIPAPRLELPTLRKEDLPSYKDVSKVCEEGSEGKSEEEAGSLEEEVIAAIDEERALKSILKAVSRYASFLIEENVKDVINNFSPVDQVIVRLDKILSTVGVKSEAEIRALVKHFLPHLFCRTCQDRPESVDTLPDLSEQEKEPSVVYEDCQDQVIDEIMSSLRAWQEEEEVAKEGKEADVMDAISSCVRDRITVIDTVISQELTVTTSSLPPPPQPQVDMSLSQVLQTEARRETLEVMPDSMSQYLRIGPTQVAGHQVSSFLSQHATSKTDRRWSLSWCLQEKHDVTIDRLVLVKALCAYSKEINNRTQQKEVKSLDNMISEKWMTVSRSLSNEDIKSFWRAFDMITREKQQLWDTFTQGLTEYHNELTERSRLNEEIVRMKRNNSDLLRLLQKYLSISTEQCLEMDFPKLKQYFPDQEDLTETDNKPINKNIGKKKIN